MPVVSLTPARGEARDRPLVFGQEKDRPRSRLTITIRDGGAGSGGAQCDARRVAGEAFPSPCQRQPSISPSLGGASMKRSTLCSKSRSSRVSATYIRIRLPQAAAEDGSAGPAEDRSEGCSWLATTWVEGQVLEDRVQLDQLPRSRSFRSLVGLQETLDAFFVESGPGGVERQMPGPVRHFAAVPIQDALHDGYAPTQEGYEGAFGHSSVRTKLFIQSDRMAEEGCVDRIR